MLRSMLVGLDGSTHSGRAVELGVCWAQRYKAMLVGIGIVDEPTIRKAEPVPLGATHFKQERDDALVADAGRRVEQFAARCAETRVAYKRLENVGLPAEQIVLEAQRYDLVLLGQQTYFHFETQLEPDDTLLRVLKNSPCPVVTSPEKPAAGSGVVVAYDGSLQAARTLQAFQAVGLHNGHEVHVVCVHADRAEAARRCDRAVDYLRFHEIVAQPHALGTSAQTAEVILDQVRLLNGGLLIMGAYGQPTLREFLFGSVTRTMLRQSPAPLFLYH